MFGEDLFLVLLQRRVVSYACDIERERGRDGRVEESFELEGLLVLLLLDGGVQDRF